jgi:hypothetical protein
VCDFIPECVSSFASDISDYLLITMSSVLIRVSPWESSKNCTGAQASLPASWRYDPLSFITLPGEDQQAGRPALPTYRNLLTNSAERFRKSSQSPKIAGSCIQMVSH